MTVEGKWRASTILLVVSGVCVAGIGAYFIALRPPLLAEDVRFMNLTDAEAAGLLPPITPWLAQVVKVLGGYSMATGLLVVTLAMTSFGSRSPIAFVGAALAGVASIGVMTAVNFTLNSDFKWFLAGIALLWALSLAAYAVESRPKPRL